MYVQDDGRVTSSAARSPLPTVLGDPLPAFEPALWVVACHETAWATSQVQGFQYGTVDGGYAMVVRDCLRPAEQQVLWREDVTAAMLEEAGTAAGADGLYRSAHTRMSLFIATHATAIVAERYRELKRSQLRAGGGL
jgi:hypothetical protein